MFGSFLRAKKKDQIAEYNDLLFSYVSSRKYLISTMQFKDKYVENVREKDHLKTLA